MNKSTPEYIRVREEIAKKYCGHNSKIGFILADRILAIKGVAILADKQQLPEHYDGIYTGYEEAVQRDMLKVNFKKVVE